MAIISDINFCCLFPTLSFFVAEFSGYPIFFYNFFPYPLFLLPLFLTLIFAALFPTLSFLVAEFSGYPISVAHFTVAIFAVNPYSKYPGSL